MTTAIQQFIDILADNEYRAKYKEIPEDVDNRDEIIAEIQEILDDDGLMPDSLRFFELNDNTNASELSLHLRKSFQKFKNEFLAGKHDDNDLFMIELVNQISLNKKEIEQQIRESKQINDETLVEMFEAKAMICNEVYEFVKSHKQTPDQKSIKKEPKEKLSFKWLKDDILLTEFYDKLKSDKLISDETDLEDFKTVFANKPVSDIINPIKWEKGAKLFAYFFYRIIKDNYIAKKPSWINLQYCFLYISETDGDYIPIPMGVKSNVTEINKYGKPKGADLIDALFQLGSGQTK